MPSGGYGVGTQEDFRAIREILSNTTVKQFGLQVEVLAAYVAARMAGATEKRAVFAAYEEWDV